MSLIAWWPLNGDTLDYSGNGNHGVNNGATIDNNGKIGKCYDFDGSKTCDISTSNLDIHTESFSVAMWVYYRDFTYPKTFGAIKKSSGSTYQQGYVGWDFGHGYSDVGVNVVLNDGINLKRGVLEFNEGSQPKDLLNCWHHIVYVVDRGLKRVFAYVDGIRQIGNLDISTITGCISSNSAVKIGSMYGWHTDGKLNDIRIYDHALSEKEIKELAKAKILHYTFNDFQEPTENIMKSPVELSIGSWSSYGSGDGSADTSIEVLTDTGYDSSNSLKITKISDLKSVTTAASNSAFTNPTLPAGGKVTISCYAKGVNNSVGKNIRLHGYGSNSEKTVSTGQTFTLTRDWKRYSYTYTNSTSSDLLLSNIYFVGYNLPQIDDYFLVSLPQVELKDHATPFTPTSRSGIVRDISGYGNDAVLELATTPKWTEDSKISGGCYEFNGKDTYVKPNNIDIMNVMTVESFSISFWIKREDTSGEIHDIIGGGNYGHSTGGVAFSLHSNGSFYYDIYTEMAGRHCITLSSSTIASNIWNHVILFVNRENNTFGIYVNGINVSERNLANELISWNINNYPLKIGKGYYAGTLGLIDDIRIYATALSDKDIKELYQTRASLDNKGNFNIGKLEERPNIAYKVDNAIKDKVYQDGLNSYTQSNCKVTLTDKGFRIYRPPNLSPTVDGNTMWGGLKVQLFKIDSNILKKGHKYRISFIVTGQSSNGAERIYFSNNMGWSGTSRGLTCVSASKYNSLESNFKGSKEIYAVFDITDDIWKVCTSSYSSFVEGEYYNCYRDLCWGFEYKDTGELGTDLYVTNFKVVDITEDESTLIKDSGVVKSSHISELGPTDGLITYYPLNGNPKDLSGNKLDGIVNGATVSNGLEGLCYEFDGVDNYIEVPNNLILSPSYITIALWVYFNESKVAEIIRKPGQYEFFQSSQKVVFRTFLGEEDLSNNTSIPLNTWTYITAVFDGRQKSIYVNGILDSNIVDISGTLKASTNSFEIGRYYNGSYPFKGKIQDVRIYNRALTQEEIMILYKMKGSNSKMQLVNNGTLYVNKIIEGY